MRILDQNTDKSIETILLYLTVSEAQELRDSLNILIKKPTDNHEHVSSENYQKEITVCVYDPNDLNHFNDRSKKLIVEDR